jgi:cytochrome c-type biogenesis protein CcmE
MGYRGAATSWQYYLLVDECVRDAESLQGQRLRVSGRVAAGSLAMADDRSKASFILSGPGHTLRVTCAGPLPDNLAEGMDVVVEGRLQSTDCLHGDKIVTRCASKYVP